MCKPLKVDGSITYIVELPSLPYRTLPSVANPHPSFIGCWNFPDYEK